MKIIAKLSAIVAVMMMVGCAGRPPLPEDGMTPVQAVEIPAPGRYLTSNSTHVLQLGGMLCEPLNKEEVVRSLKSNTATGIFRIFALAGDKHKREGWAVYVGGGAVLAYIGVKSSDYNIGGITKAMVLSHDGSHACDLSGNYLGRRRADNKAELLDQANATDEFGAKIYDGPNRLGNLYADLFNSGLLREVTMDGGQKIYTTISDPYMATRAYRQQPEVTVGELVGNSVDLNPIKFAGLVIKGAIVERFFPGKRPGLYTNKE